MNLEKSRESYNRSLEHLVGGVNSPVRSFKRVGGQVIIGKRARGALIWDLDGNEYIDLVMSYGPQLLGHSYPQIVDSVENFLKDGFCLGMSTVEEQELADKIVEALPAVDKVRLVNSGTEACMTAIRMARGITGRDLIVKCAGHYHGHADTLLVSPGSGVATLNFKAKAECKGVPDCLADLARVVEFNNFEELEKVFSDEGEQIAAYILEPVMGNMGVIPPDVEYLKRARELCDKHSTILIFDEVMTGFRVHPESAQGLYGVEPDLSCFGKVIGGGMPLAAVAGKAEFMDSLAPVGEVYQAGTLSGNPIAVAAGNAQLQAIAKLNPYPHLEKVGAHLESELLKISDKVNVPYQVQRVGSMLSVFFREKPARNDKDSMDVDHEVFKKFFWRAIEEGIMLPPSPYEACFLSLAHEEYVDKLVDKLQKSLLQI